MMVFHEVKHVIVAYKFMTCMSMQFVILQLTMMNVLMMTCKTWHVDYFILYYDGIANALVAF